MSGTERPVRQVNEQPAPRYDPNNIPVNAPPPQSNGGASRFDPTNIPVNGQAPGLSAEPAADLPSDSAPDTSSGPSQGSNPSSDEGAKERNP